MTIATIFAEPLEVAGLWLATMGLISGADAAWAWLGGADGPEIGDAAQRGLAVGFIADFYVAVIASLYLLGIFGG